MARHFYYSYSVPISEIFSIMSGFLKRIYLPVTCTGGALFGGVWGIQTGADNSMTRNMSLQGATLWKMVYIPFWTVIGFVIGGGLGPIALPVLIVDRLVNYKN